MPDEDGGSGRPRQMISTETMVESIRQARADEHRGSGRRRRRRTHQPQKKRARRRRMLILWSVAFIILLVVVLVGGAFFVKQRLETEEFREGLGRSLEHSFGGKVLMGPLEVRGMAVHTPWVTVAGAKGARVESVELKQVEIVLAWPSFVGSTWLAKSISIDRCDLVITPGATATVDGEGEAASMGGGIAAVPSQWRIEDGTIEVLNVDWKDGGGNEGVALKDVRLVAMSLNGTGRGRLVGGTVQGIGQGEFELRGAEIVLKGGRLGIEGGTLRSGGGEGEIGFEASLSLESGEVAMLRLVPEGVDVRPFLPAPWGERVLGKVVGELKVAQTIGSGDAAELDGEFTLREGALRGMPFLSELSELCGESRLLRVELSDEAAFRVRRQGGVLKVDEIAMTKNGLFRAAGAFEVAVDGLVSGQLRVGLPETLLSRSTVDRPSFFGPPDGGFCLAEVNLSGSGAQVAEDLSSRLESYSAATGGTVGGAASSGGVSRTARGSNGSSNDAGLGRRPLIDEKAKMEALFDALLE